MSLFAKKSSEDDDPAARAYEAISNQLQQWGEPLDDDDNDVAMEEEEDVTFRLVSRSSFESPLPTTDSVMTTPSAIRTPYASKTPLSILRSNYKGSSPLMSPASLNLASQTGVETPGNNVSMMNDDNQEAMMNEDHDAYFYDDYRTYHDATSKWLLQQQHDWMVNSCENKSENSIWNLISALMQTMNHLHLPINSAHDVQQYMQRLISIENEDFLTAWYDKLDSYEEQNETEAAEEKQKDDITPPSSLVRRQLILDWLEMTEQDFDPSNLRQNNHANNSVMWADSVQYLNRYPASSASDKIQMIDPDAKGDLYGQDEVSDQRLLQSCWKYLRSGQWARAMDACRDANQFWRCVAYNGVASHYDTDSKQFKKEAYVLSKRNAWESSNSMAKSNRPSVQYESAIFAVWANHTQSVLQNPIIFKTGDQSNTSKFLTMLWIHYRAMSERCMEELHHHYYYSTTQKRENFYAQQKQIDQLLHEQLQATENISRWREIDIITKVSSQIKGENDVEATYLGAISAILQGSVESWVACNIEILSKQSDHTHDSHLKIVRFVVHVLLYLRLHVDNVRTLIDSKESSFLSTYIEKHLIGKSNLWSYVTLYSILLPAEECWGVLLQFWKEVNDPEIQNMLVQQAKEYLPRLHNGEDAQHVLLVQAVVREILDLKSNEITTTNDAFSDSPWFTVLPPSSPEKEDLSPVEIKMDQSIDQIDIRKMQSFSWFDFLSTSEDGDIPEDDGDRWVCTNILLRQFLLDSCTLTAELMENIDNDWIRNFMEKDEKLYAARVFVDRYLPSKDTTECDDDTSWEFDAITSYVQSQVDFISWHHALLEYDPVVSKKKFTNSRNSLQNEIAAKMERKTYCDDKRSVAKNVITAAIKASESLSKVLTYNGGWLFADEGIIIEDGKKEQWQALRNKCLPHTVYLLTYVFKQTAKWMQIFLKDIELSFGKEAKSISTQIDVSSTDDSLMKPISWLRMSLDVATIIASSEHSILDCIPPEVLDLIVTDMANTGAEILTCSQDE